MYISHTLHLTLSKTNMPLLQKCVKSIRTYGTFVTTDITYSSPALKGVKT